MGGIVVIITREIELSRIILFISGLTYVFFGNIFRTVFFTCTRVYQNSYKITYKFKMYKSIQQLLRFQNCKVTNSSGASALQPANLFNYYLPGISVRAGADLYEIKPAGSRGLHFRDTGFAESGIPEVCNNPT